MERTLCILKPDAVERGLIGEILLRFERIGLKIVAMKMIQASKSQAEDHYSWEDIGLRHGEVIRNRLIDFIIKSPILIFVVEGDQAVQISRKLCGTTEPALAPLGTIRGDFSHQSFTLANEQKKSIYNLIHSSASHEEAQREINIWFEKDEILRYKRNDEKDHYLN